MDSVQVSPTWQRLARKLHRSLTPVLLLPILITALTGAIHPMLRAAGVPKEQIKWMIRIHSGNFLVLDLKPIYPFLVGLSTVVLAISGLMMYLRASRNQPLGS